jgi:hypothetical protein
MIDILLFILIAIFILCALANCINCILVLRFCYLDYCKDGYREAEYDGVVRRDARLKPIREEEEVV